MLEKIDLLINYFDKQEDKFEEYSLSKVYLKGLNELKLSLENHNLDSDKAMKHVYGMLRVLDEAHLEFQNSEIGKIIRGLAYQLSAEYKERSTKHDL